MNSEEHEQSHAQIYQFTRWKGQKKVWDGTLWEGESWAGLEIANGAVTRLKKLGEDGLRRECFLSEKKKKGGWENEEIKRKGRDVCIYTYEDKELKRKRKMGSSGVQLFLG